MLLGHRIDQYALTREDRREPFGRPCALAGLVDPGQRLQRDAEIEIVAVKRATEILPIAAHGQSGSTDRAAEIEGEDLIVGIPPELQPHPRQQHRLAGRTEERRVGTESGWKCSTMWSSYH